MTHLPPHPKDNARVHYAQIHGEVKCSECHMVCVGTEGLKGHVKAFHQVRLRESHRWFIWCFYYLPIWFIFIFSSFL